MSPAPFVERHVPAEHERNPRCRCSICRPVVLKADRWLPAAFLITAVVLACVIWFLAFSDSAGARAGKAPEPIAAPPALLAARAACTDIDACRSALVREIAAVRWQRNARLHASLYGKSPYGVQHALRLAAAMYDIPLGQMRRVAHCESRLRPAAENPTSSARGLFQFLPATWQRAGVPGFSPLDPYASALATARLVHHDGSWREWSCGSHA